MRSPAPWLLSIGVALTLPSVVTALPYVADVTAGEDGQTAAERITFATSVPASSTIARALALSFAADASLWTAVDLEAGGPEVGLHSDTLAARTPLGTPR